MVDYTIFYKTALPVDADWATGDPWDLFISCYNPSERVQTAYGKAVARAKTWLVLPDYGYDEADIPTGEVFVSTSRHEADYVLEYFEWLQSDLTNIRVCVDITGFLKPYMMFMLRALMNMGLARIDVIYSEPGHYAEKEETKFSDGPVYEVRQVAGFEGSHSPDTSNDMLVIGAGYDHELIKYAAEDKDHARKIQVFGWPSLRADMYQENVLRAHRAAEAVGRKPRRSPHDLFAPANDPFVTATVLSEMVERQRQRTPITNLYLCPLATKPQALGFTLYYLRELQDTPASMIYPFCLRHARETSRGVSRVWMYEVEFLAGSRGP